MPCNAKVVVKTQVKITDINKIPNLRRTATGYIGQLSPLVNIEVDGRGNATLRYSGQSWEEGVSMLNKACLYLKKFSIDLSNMGKPETHRHDNPGTQIKLGGTA